LKEMFWWWTLQILNWRKRHMRMCGCSQNSTGANWIPWERSSKRNLLWCLTREIVVKGSDLQNICPTLSKLLVQILTMFVSTYCCKSAFSNKKW